MDLIRHYMKGGINVNAADYDKRTALHIAAADGCLEVVSPLLLFLTSFLLPPSYHLPRTALQCHTGAEPAQRSVLQNSP